MKKLLKTLVTVSGCIIHVVNAANPAAAQTAIHDEETKSLLEKCKLPKVDPHNLSKTKTTSAPILSDEERAVLVFLAEGGNIDAQHYVWIGYFNGLYGFKQSLETASALKARFKAENNARKASKSPTLPK